MGKHFEWRKLAKKARRKRLRCLAAKYKEKLKIEEKAKRENSPSYIKYLEEQNQLEEFQQAEETRIHKEQEKQYQERERLAQIEWQELQKKLQIAWEERAKQNAKIKEEWEREQARLKTLKEEKERLEEEKRLMREKLQMQIDEFINNGEEMPDELNEMLETNPGKVTCPFYMRTAACRFGDMCSRNHIRPTISRVLLVKNFYSHYSLDTIDNEHGDSTLEFENKEIYKHFKEFFKDVVPEFENFGIVRQFKVCCNKEAHLRGNVYVEYSNCRDAMRSYGRFCGRYYAGKQLNVQFCTIDSWKSAICGLFFRKQCPKGSVCNFLHVFRNPDNLFMKADKDLHRTPPLVVEDENVSNSWSNSERRHWRWSESPELIIPEENERELKNNKTKSCEKHSHHKVKRSRQRISSKRSHKNKKRQRSRSKSSHNTSRSRSRSHQRERRSRRKRSRS